MYMKYAYKQKGTQMLLLLQTNNDNDCAPIALFNALVSCGDYALPFSYIKEAMHTDEDGTYEEDLNQFINSHISNNVITQIGPFNTVHSRIVLSVTDWAGDDHVVALVDSSPKAAYCSNWYTRKGKFVNAWIPWSTLRKVWNGWGRRLYI